MYIYIELYIYIYTYPVTVIITGIDGHNLRYNHRTSPRRWCPSFPAPKWSRWWPTLVKHRRRRMKGYRKVGEKWWQNARNPKFHLALAAQMHKWWLYHGFAQKNGDLLPFRHAFTKKANHFTIFSGFFPPKRWYPGPAPETTTAAVLGVRTDPPRLFGRRSLPSGTPCLGSWQVPHIWNMVI